MFITALDCPAQQPLKRDIDPREKYNVDTTIKIINARTGEEVRSYHYSRPLGDRVRPNPDIVNEMKRLPLKPIFPYYDGPSLFEWLKKYFFQG